MKGLRYLEVSCFLLGIIAIIYGWTQSWDFGASTEVYEEILMKRTAKTYVFMGGGFILIIISSVVSQVKRVLEQLLKEKLQS